MHMHTHMHARTHLYTCACINIWVHMYTWTHILAHMCTHTETRHKWTAVNLPCNMRSFLCSSQDLPLPSMNSWCLNSLRPQFSMYVTSSVMLFNESTAAVVLRSGSHSCHKQWFWTQTNCAETWKEAFTSHVTLRTVFALSGSQFV